MAVEYERQATVEREVELIVAELLRGVSLSEMEEERARAIIRADVEARRALPRSPADAPFATFATFDRGLASMDERDTALRAMLATAARRAALEANVAVQREVHVDLRRRAVEHYRREHPEG